MNSLSSEKPAKEKPQKRWFVTWDYNSARCDMVFVNREKILKNLGQLVFSAPIGIRGFPTYPETPKIVFNCKSRKRPLDVEPFSDYWLVSEKAKLLFESLAPEAFAFCKCDVTIDGKSDGLEYWLCDIMTVLDAVDEERSDIDVKAEGSPSRYYHFNIPRHVEFKDQQIKHHLIFRLKYSDVNIVCNDAFKLATKELKGLQFKPPIR